MQEWGSDWQLWPNVLGKHGIRKMNVNELMLPDFCTQNSLTVSGSVFQLSNKHKTSWQHSRSKHWHQIDHIHTNPQTRSHISVTKTYLDADCYSGHKLVICKCSFRLFRKYKGRKLHLDRNFNIFLIMILQTVKLIGKT